MDLDMNDTLTEISTVIDQLQKCYRVLRSKWSHKDGERSTGTPLGERSELNT